MRHEQTEELSTEAAHHPRKPLSASSIQDLEIICCEKDGRRATAMLLTDEYMEEIETAESQIEEMGGMIAKLRQQIHELSGEDPDAPSKKERLLETGTSYLEQLNEQRDTLVHKLDKVGKESESSHKGLYGDLRRVFETYDLLEDISGTSDSGHDDIPDEDDQAETSITTGPTYNAVQQTTDSPIAHVTTASTPNKVEQATNDPLPKATPEKTPSGMQRVAERKAQYALYDQKERLDGKIEYLGQRVDEWYLEYDDALRRYKDSYARGETDDTRTMFDNDMFIAQQGVVQDLITAERELQQTMEEGRGGKSSWCHLG
ncbi:hypothetical protein HYALB_00008575 [Hymenoscyphus albidus]|uniref:Uncharacterized protein n=1 Tax=Hymenoscyphus albidus TaxID=595503 RepID=A0A9N9Q563_9HELO|nr:hypothetical protein HYALB_00008575 [Hymenoscyphus albidus]